MLTNFKIKKNVKQLYLLANENFMFPCLAVYAEQLLTLAESVNTP